MSKTETTSGNLFEVCDATVRQLLENHSYDLAALELQQLIRKIAGRPESTMFFMPSQALDALITEFAEAMSQTMSFSSIREKPDKGISVKRADVLLCTSFVLSNGGHTREIEDWVATLAATHKIGVLLSFENEKSDHAVKDNLFAAIDGYEHCLDSFSAIVKWLVEKIETINPRVVVVSPATDDIALFCALVISKFDGRLILNLNLDHNISPGLFLAAIDKIVTKRPYLYLLLKDEYKLADKIIYIPFSRRPSVDEKKLKVVMGFNREIATATCTSVTYKIENNYIYQFSDVISDLICQTGVKHVHIGAISDIEKNRIYQKLSSRGFGKEYFIHIPFAPRLSDVFIKYGVNVLIQTFPIGGGLVAVEAMECGLVVVSHRCYSTKLYNLADFCYEGAPTWGRPKELIELIQNMGSDQLKQHREKSRAHYQKFNMSGGNEKLLLDDDFQGYIFDESKYTNMFDYPLDFFRINANMKLRSFKKSLRKSLVIKLKRLPKKIKRLFC